jgi:hypothetical protein
MVVEKKPLYGRTKGDLNTFFEKKTNSLTAWKDRLF